VVSANWRRLFGVGPDQPVTFETWLEALHPQDRESAVAELNAALQEHRDYRTEYRIPLPNGAIRWIVDRGRAFYDDSGRPLRMAGVNADITERRLAEEAVRHARDDLARANIDLERKVSERTAQLVEANASLQAFAYTAAHDLRSPLRSIRNFSLIVKEDCASNLGSEGQSLLDRVVGSAEQMDRLLNDLLEYSKMKQADLSLGPVNLGKAVGEALAMLDVDIKAKNAAIDVAEPLPEAIGHHATVVLLINNIVSNAIKFMPPDARPEIRIWAETAPLHVRLFVQDNGIGIAPEHLEKIFAPFERLHSKTVFAGTGLGLAIVRQGAQRMGGQVGVQSAPGKGSTFWIELRSP
jgi:PAS domain S-box-containing protein